METEVRICKVLSEVMGRELTPEQLKNQRLSSLNINSMTFLKIIVNLEDEFDVTFDDEEINYDMFGSFEQLCRLMETNRGGVQE